MWSLWSSRKRKEEAKQETAKAAEALNSAKRTLRAVEKRGEEVTRISQALRDLRERNGFAEVLEAIITSRGGSLNDTGR
jgi:hypothetical protein